MQPCHQPPCLLAVSLKFVVSTELYITGWVPYCCYSDCPVVLVGPRPYQVRPYQVQAWLCHWFCNPNLRFSRLRNTACQIDVLIAISIYQAFFFLTTSTQSYNVAFTFQTTPITLSNIIFVRFATCNQPDLWWPVQDFHLHLHWWTCYHCHLEKKLECDNSEYYLPANQESSWSCKYLPDNAHHWLISESEWHPRDIQLHSGECQGKIIKDGVGNRWELKPCN